MKRVADASRIPRIQGFERDVQNGRIVNIVMDGWESQNKKHTIGVVLQSGNKWITHANDNGNYDKSDVHHGIAVAREIKSIMNNVTNAYKNIKFQAICTDDAGQYTRARRILSKRYPHWSFTHCFAHQINLIVKDVLKAGYGDIVQQAAVIVAKINKSSSKWLI